MQLMKDLTEKRYNANILKYIINNIEIPIGYDGYIYGIFRRTLNIPPIPETFRNCIDYINSLDIDSDIKTSIYDITDMSACADEEYEVAQKIADFIISKELEFCWIDKNNNPYKQAANWDELINSKQQINNTNIPDDFNPDDYMEIPM